MNIENELISLEIDDCNLAEVDLGINDSEQEEIENHLVRLYLRYLAEYYDGLVYKISFEEFIKRGLYVASADFCYGNKEQAGVLLGLSASNLRTRMKGYFGTSRVSGTGLSGLDSRLYVLYKNYFSQFYGEGINIDSRFAEIVDRAMYRAVLHFSSGNRTKAGKILKIGRKTFKTREDACFAGRDYSFSYKKAI